MKHDQMYITADIVVLKRKEDLEILLIKRKKEPFKDMWALPGGFVDLNEDLKDAAKRELKEETSLNNLFLEQIGAFGNPNRDPRGRIVSIAFLAITKEDLKANAGDDAKETKWFSLKDMPEEIAFDHKIIIESALKKIIKED